MIDECDDELIERILRYVDPIGQSRMMRVAMRYRRVIDGMARRVQPRRVADDGAGLIRAIVAEDGLFIAGRVLIGIRAAGTAHDLLMSVFGSQPVAGDEDGAELLTIVHPKLLRLAFDIVAASGGPERNAFARALSDWIQQPMDASDGPCWDVVVRNAHRVTFSVFNLFAGLDEESTPIVRAQGMVVGQIGDGMPAMGLSDEEMDAIVRYSCVSPAPFMNDGPDWSDGAPRPSLRLDFVETGMMTTHRMVALAWRYNIALLPTTCALGRIMEAWPTDAPMEELRAVIEHVDRAWCESETRPANVVMAIGEIILRLLAYGHYSGERARGGLAERRCADELLDELVGRLARGFATLGTTVRASVGSGRMDSPFAESESTSVPFRDLIREELLLMLSIMVSIADRHDGPYIGEIWYRQRSLRPALSDVLRVFRRMIGEREVIGERAMLMYIHAAPAHALTLTPLMVEPMLSGHVISSTSLRPLTVSRHGASARTGPNDPDDDLNDWCMRMMLDHLAATLPASAAERCAGTVGTSAALEPRVTPGSMSEVPTSEELLEYVAARAAMYALDCVSRGVPQRGSYRRMLARLLRICELRGGPGGCGGLAHGDAETVLAAWELVNEARSRGREALMQEIGRYETLRQPCYHVVEDDEPEEVDDKR